MKGQTGAPRPRIAVYGGSFDPVHNGHLIMAVLARDAFALDRVLFVPARQSPFKTAAPVCTDADRLTLLEMAIAGERGLEVSPYELQREPPSYTVDTLRILQTGCEASWFLLIGADQLTGLSDWHDFPALRALLCGILVAPRFGDLAGELALPGDPFFQALEAPAIGISSTLIRRRLAAGLGVRGMLPDAVHQQITAAGWYRDRS